MPGYDDSRDSVSGGAPKMRFTQRLLLALPHFKRRGDKAPLRERVKDALVKPAPPGEAEAKASLVPTTIEELEDHVKYTDDRERLVGFLAAPFGGAIGILIILALINHDPAALLRDGQVNKLHVSVSLYHELEIVLLVLSALMMVMAWARKRLYLGMVMALYGLAVFNLHYWGFGIPYVMFGAWLLVRAYRAQRALREATGEPSTFGAQWRGGGSNAPRPRSTKRYGAPPPKWASAPKLPPPPKGQKPDKEQQAG